MKKLKYIIAIVVIMVILLIAFNKCNKKDGKTQNTNEYAESTTSILDMTEEEKKNFGKNLVRAIVKNDFNEIITKSYLIDSTCYYSLTDYANSSDIKNGNMSDLVIDVITVEKSSTSDDVIMCNAKIWFDDTSYNMLYTFEFHINSNGVIYGYNIWVH